MAQDVERSRWIELGSLGGILQRTLLMRSTPGFSVGSSKD
jgi:hypothetical protein